MRSDEILINMHAQNSVNFFGKIPFTNITTKSRRDHLLIKRACY